MIVLSRRVNDAVVLADRVIITVIRILPDKAELSVRTDEAGPITLVAVGIGESTDVGFGASMSLTEVRAESLCSGVGCDVPKARLGFDLPPTVSVCRFESYDAHGRVPKWHFPKAGAAPSLN
ncbi:MAG: hypothetical protein HY040_14415 [Planctomycetes bacterium]|nr:hypothetical protein [Planctomycetota bacterium]